MCGNQRVKVLIQYYLRKFVVLWGFKTAHATVTLRETEYSREKSVVISKFSQFLYRCRDVASSQEFRFVGANKCSAYIDAKIVEHKSSLLICRLLVTMAHC